MDNLMKNRQKNIDMVNSWFSDPVPTKAEPTAKKSTLPPAIKPLPPTSPTGGGGTGEGDGKGKKNKKSDPTPGVSTKTWLEATKGEVEAWTAIYDQAEKERKEALSNLLKDLAHEYDGYYLELEQKAAQGQLTDDELKAQKLTKELEHLNAKKLFLASYGEETIGIEREIAQKQIQIKSEAHDQDMEMLRNKADAEKAYLKEMQELKEKQLQAEKSVEQAKEELWASGIQALMGFAKEQSAIWKALFLVQKGIAIAEIISTTTVAITKYQGALASYSLRIAASMGTDALAWAGFGATTAQIAAAKMNAVASIASIGAQTIPVFAKAIGGYTDMQTLQTDNSGQPAGFVTSPTLFGLGARSFVAGEAGTEYVISNPMLKNPVIANFAAMLEMYRKGQALPTSASGSTSDLQVLIPLLQDISAKLNQRQTVTFNYSEFEKYRDFINFIREDAA